MHDSTNKHHARARDEHESVLDQIVVDSEVLVLSCSRNSIRRCQNSSRTNDGETNCLEMSVAIDLARKRNEPIHRTRILTCQSCRHRTRGPAANCWPTSNASPLNEQAIRK